MYNKENAGIESKDLDKNKFYDMFNDNFNEAIDGTFGIINIYQFNQRRK